jgi:uncharacterized protein (TIGR03437 family)
MNVLASLRIMDRPTTISPGGVVNAASYQSGFVSAFEIVNIFGSGFGPQQLVKAAVPQAGTLPTELAGVSVTVGGGPLQLLYVQDKVIAAIMPSVLDLYDEPLTFTVSLGGTPAASLAVPAPPPGPGINNTGFAPALFTSNASGSGTLAAVNADGTLNSPQNPAKKGSVVLLYGTGFFSNGNNVAQGDQTVAACTEKQAFGPLLLLGTPPVEAFINGKPAYVIYSGSSPGMTCAVQQFNVAIPDSSDTGPDVPVQLGMPFLAFFSNAYTWYWSQPGTTIAIK